MKSFKWFVLSALFLLSCKNDVNKPRFFIRDIPVFRAGETEFTVSTGMIDPQQANEVEENYYLRMYPAYLTRTGQSLVVTPQMTDRPLVFEDSGPEGSTAFRLIDFLNESFAIIQGEQSGEFSYSIIDIVSGQVFQTEGNILSLAISPDASRILYSYKSAATSGLSMILLKKTHEIVKKWEHLFSDTLVTHIGWEKDTSAVIAYASNNKPIKYGTFTIPGEKISYISIIGNQIWVRDAPSTGEVVMKLDDGTICELLQQGPSQEIGGKRDYWLEISCFGKKGWVFGSQTSLQQVPASFDDYLSLFNKNSTNALPSVLAVKYLDGMQGFAPFIFKKVKAYSRGTGTDGTEDIVWAYLTVLKKVNEGPKAALLLAGYYSRDEEYKLDFNMPLPDADPESGKQPGIYFEGDQLVVEIPESRELGAYKYTYYFAEAGQFLEFPVLDEPISARTSEKLFELLDTLFETHFYSSNTEGMEAVGDFSSSSMTDTDYGFISFFRSSCGATCYGSNSSVFCYKENDWWTYRRDFQVFEGRNHIPGACTGIYELPDPGFDLVLFEEKIENHIITTTSTKRFYLFNKSEKRLSILDLKAQVTDIIDESLVVGECESEELMVAEELEFDPRDLSAVKKIYQREFEVQNEDEGGRCIEKSKKLVREEFYRWDESRMNFVLHETK